MPDLRQALKDFVATSNSGKYQDEKTLLSKFPELNGFDINVLKDFVATSNSGKYVSEDDLFSKFPEFNLSSQKKSEFGDGTTSMESASKDGSLASAKLPKLNLSVSAPEYTTATQPKKEYVEPEPDKQGLILNAVSSLSKGFYQNLLGNPIKGLGTALEGATGKAFLSDALIKFGDYFNNAIDELAPEDEEFKGTLTDQFGQAFGQIASMIVTAGAGGAAGKALEAGGKGATALAEAELASQMAPAAGALEAGKIFTSELFSPSSVSAGLSMGQAEFDRAKQAGATDDQAFEAFYKNAVVGSVLEQIPVMQFMKRFNKATAGGLIDYIKNRSVAGLTGGVEEMTTEVLQQLYANKSAQDIYNINQDLFEGVGESGGVGFGVGFLLNAMGANVRLLRQSGKNQQADVVEAQIRELQNQAKNGGPSSYTLNGIKVEAPVIEDMINNMSATDLAKANIEITNDPALKIKMQNKIVTSSIKEQVREANPDLNEESLDAITELEKELRKFEGNTTQSGKDKAAAIRQQIRNIQENPLPAKVDEAVARNARIAEIEAIAPENMTTELETELQTLKTERDAVQKLSTDEGVLRTEQPQMGLQEVGEGNKEPEVITEGTQEEIEKQRQEALDNIVEYYLPNKIAGQPGDVGFETEFRTFKYNDNGENVLDEVKDIAGKTKEEAVDLINKFYDEKIAALPQPVSLKTQEEVKPNTEIFFDEMDTVFPNDHILGGYAATDSEGKLLGRILMSQVDDNTVKIDEIVSEKRGERTGNGSAIMKIVTEYADKNNVKITLTPNIIGEMKAKGFETSQKLQTFYEKFGFVKDKGKATMTRLPIKIATQPVSLKTQQRVVVAPFFNTMATTQEEAVAVRQSPEYKQHLDMLNGLAKQMGLEIEAINENIGGYQNEAGEKINEVSNTVFLKNATIEQAEEYAALAAALTPQVQESSIAAQYTEQEAPNHNANEYSFKVSNINKALDALKSAGIVNFTVDESTNTVSFLDVFDFSDAALEEKIGNLIQELEKNGVTYEQQDFRPVESRYIGKTDRKKILSRIKSKGTQLGPSGQNILQTVEQSVERDAAFRGISKEEYFKPERGNRLFNERLKNVADIASRYFKRVFGLERPEYYGQKKIDKAFAKRISDAFDAMKHDPTNPEVKAAYEALAKETVDQYNAFIDAGYRVEINNEEPYANSQDMIDDLRDNKRIKIFSTESGFGDNPITPEQRAENPLLQPSGFVDSNGQPLLINDLFRAIHDFFGHAELGNSFGPIGEENAWQVHARMFSPLARKAMTTETRGQNSFVNFSGVNDRINEIRAEARKLRQQGKIKEAQDKVSEIYEKGSFAEQKVGLLPEEFYQIDESNVGDEDLIPVEEVSLKTQPEITKVQEFPNLAPNGKKSNLTPEQYKLVRTRDFKEWFGDWENDPEKASKVVDENGEPLVIYHGSEFKFKEFKNLYNEKTKSFFFSSDIDNAKTYGGNVINVFLNLRNPYVVEANGASFTNDISVEVLAKYPNEEPYFTKIGMDVDEIVYMVKNGKRIDQFIEIPNREKYDGIIFKNIIDPSLTSRRDVKQDTIIAFSSDQIKLADDLNINAKQGNIETLMTADTKDQTTFERVYNFLDRIDSNLEQFGRETAGINIALPVMKAIIKTLKVLVKTGITLQEAIEKVATQYNVSKQDVIDSIQTIATMREEAGQGVELNEATLPGYNRMMQEIDGIVEKALSRGAEQDRIVNDVISYLQGTKVYENATDTQREALVREARKLFGLREKYAPSAERVLGQPTTTVTVNEMTALKDQLRLEARAAREAKNDMNAKRKAIADVIRSIEAKGTITVQKAKAMINKLSNLNLYNTEAVERYIDYVGKVFADAEYNSKLSTANNIRKQLKKLSKNKDKSANLRSLSSKFVEIDPSMVEDIDEYNKNAALILDSIKGSTIRGSNVRFAEMVRESDAMDYINNTIESQQQKLYEMKLAAIQELLGVDASELNYEQLVELMAKDEPMTKYNESIVRDAIQKAFDIYSAIVKESLSSGKDVFTGEDIEYTASQKKIIKQFMDMDINALKPKQALEAVDSLMNFLQNQSTAKMEAVVRAYNGEINARELANKGIKASPLKKYWSKNLGRFLGEYTTNLNILFEKMFKGFGRGGMVEDKSGVTALKNGKAVGQTQANQIVNDYVKQFYNKKANGEAFNTGYNAIERGMISFMTRNIIGTQEEMNAEFERRKNLVKESIDVLSQGNEQEVEKAKLYQEAYDKLVEGSTTIDEVMDKADPVNMDAVNFWVEQWANKYDELSDVSLNVYNKILGQDINYTPDKFSKLSSDTGVVELSNDDMAFHNNNGTIYKKETGVLMSATRPESLPVNPKNGEPNRYIDLSFDKNNANSMYDALVDINTAGPIRQVEAFLNSSSFRKIVPEANDATILKTRINLFTNNIRQKNPYTNDELSKAVRKLNKLAAIGVGQSLGGITQPIKQVIPVAMNTLINGGGLDLGAMFDKSKNDFINRSGYSIANRGIESQAQVESLNKLIDEAANSKGQALIKKIEDLNRWWLKKFLVNPDVFIARASWMTYYEQNLKQQGIDPNTIDYSTHEVNQEAADYAQRMVDRQQNVSDADLAGKLFADKEPTKQVFVKMLMPFASFRMNQSSRLGADLGTIMSDVSTKEDKKIAIRSLAGFAVEMATFRMISIGTGVLIAALVKGVMGREDDEEKDQKKLDAIIKGQMTGTVGDVFSPLPITDRALQMGVSYALDTVQDAMNVAEEDKVSIYSGAKQDFVQSLGLFGIAADRALQLYDLASLSAGGSFKDDYNRKKYVSSDDRDKLGYLIGPALLVNIGLAPSEVNSIVRSSLSDAKRNASTKEGGGTEKSKEEIEIKEKRKEKKESSKSEKIDALKELKRKTYSTEKRKIINDMIDEYSMTDEERKADKEKMSEEKRQKKLEMEELLGEYDSKSDMKRYNPSLYERKFGENSDYYRNNKAEIEVEKELNRLIRKREDRRRGYVPKSK